MDAKQAKKLTGIHRRMNTVFDRIRNTANKGENSVHTVIDDDVREELKKLGYHCSPEIDCDSDYRGDWISW